MGRILRNRLYDSAALPAGGYLYEYDLFLSAGDRSYIWSSTEFEYEGSTDYAAYRLLNEWGPDRSARWIWKKGSGYSVRCIRD